MTNIHSSRVIRDIIEAYRCRVIQGMTNYSQGVEKTKPETKMHYNYATKDN